MKRQMVYVLGFVGFLVVLTTAWAMTSRVGYESADYQLIESDGNIEIRKYPELVLAATTSDLDSQGRDGSFMRLFRYISGDNQAKQKIATQPGPGSLLHTNHRLKWKHIKIRKLFGKNYIPMITQPCNLSVDALHLLLKVCATKTTYQRCIIAPRPVTIVHFPTPKPPDTHPPILRLALSSRNFHA